MTESYRLLRRGRRLLSLLAILALLLGTLPALAFEPPIPSVYYIFTSDQTCHFEWYHSEGAVEYYVYRSVDGGTPEYHAITTNDYINDTGLEYNRRYSYTVKAFYGFGGTSQPSQALETIPVATPDISSCKELYTPGELKVFLEWAAVPGAQSYEITRSGSDSSFRSFSTVDKWYYDSADLKTNVTYTYTLNAFGLNSMSSDSSAREITLLGSVDVVQTSAKIVGNSVSLTWDPVPLAARYEIDRLLGHDGDSLVTYQTTGTSFSQSNLSYDNMYQYNVWGVAANGARSQFAVHLYCFPLRPPVLTGLSEYGPPTMPAVKLSWNAVEHANSYQVYRSVNGGAYTFLKGTTALTINDNSVQLGKTYYYKVKARRTSSFNVDAESFLSALRGVRVVGVLAAPAISSLTSASNSAYLKWAPVAGAKSYAIYRSVNGGAFQFLKGTTGLSITDAGLTYGALYSYRVQAKADSGALSPMSASRSIRIPAQPATPAISSLSLAGTTATLSWGKVNGAVSYYVYRSVNGGAYNFLKGTTATFIKDNNLETGKTYAYRVRANGNAGVYSALSAARSVKVTALGIPIIASLTNGGTTTATLTWGKVNGATSYTIYRSVNGGAYSFLKGTTALFIKDAGLSLGSSYAYRVQANGAGGLKSALSAARSITIK